MSKIGTEVRFSTGLKFRAGADDAPPVVEGYAAVFDQETRIGVGFDEVIRDGAFTNALSRGDDVVFLINHDGLPLARTRAGTLELKQDKKGLHMRAELDPSDPDVQRIVPKMERGDLDKMSFAFWIDQETWTERGDDELPLREITDLRLHDVAIVTTPAYEGTEIGLRGLERYKKSQSGKGGAKRRQRRMRMKTELAARNAKDL